MHGGQMAVQIGALRESCTAGVALERPLTRMNPTVAFELLLRSENLVANGASHISRPVGRVFPLVGVICLDMMHQGRFLVESFAAREAPDE